MTARIVVVLAVQWGGRPERWFRINPYNHSGKRLIRIIGHDNFHVTNACPQAVRRASDQGTPDAQWLADNLAVLAPTVLLVCGNVAQRTFKRRMVARNTKVLRLPHPAARTWSTQAIERAAKRVQRYTIQE